jgi:hypothetical protein
MRHRSLGVLIPDGDRLSFVRLVRRQGKLCASAHASVVLQANLLGDAPDVVGSELATCMTDRGFHETRWLLAVPPSWFAGTRVACPAGAVSDITEYAWLQAEQQLSVLPEKSVLAVSPDVDAAGVHHLTLFVMRADRFARIADTLHAADRKLIGALPAVLFEREGGGDRVRALFCAFASHNVLQITAGRHVVLLRDLPVDTESAPEEHFCALRTAVRIALASLPDTLGSRIDSVGLVADARRRDTVLAGWQQTVSGEGGAESVALAPAMSAEDGLASMAEGLAAMVEAPDRQLVFQRQVSRAAGSARRTVLVRAAAAAGIFLVALVAWGVFGVLRMRALQREADALKPQRDVVAAMRDRVRLLAPWYDRTPVSLEILRAVTEAFPERGTVWTTGLTISEGTTVSLVGKATDSTAWLSMQEALRQCPNIHDLRVSQTRSERGERGDMTFLLTFTWSRKPAS